MLGNLSKKKVITDLAIPLVRDNLPGLVSNLASNPMKKFERKITWTGAVRAEVFTLFISNEDINDIIEIKSLENPNLLIDGITETVKLKKTWNNKTKRWIYSCFVSTFCRYISATSFFFSSKRNKWNEN